MQTRSECSARSTLQGTDQRRWSLTERRKIRPGSGGAHISTDHRRHRDIIYHGVPGRNIGIHRSSGTTVLDESWLYNARGDQTTVSRDTLFPRWMRGRRRAEERGRTNTAIQRINRDIGSNFYTEKREYSDNGCLRAIIETPKVGYIGSDYSYRGPILAVDPLRGGAFSNYPVVSDVALTREMQQLGSTAIARTIPTSPAVGVGNLIGESMERLPSLPGAALLGRPGNVSKKFADEYLNYEFALKPMMSDVKGIADTIKNTNRILDQLQRDSGRLIRRRYSFPVERTISDVRTFEGYGYPQLHTRQYVGPGIFTVRRTTEKRVWFSGAYTYYYRQGSDLWSKLLRAEQAGNRLYGLRLTPSLAWELAPWSWAADWVTNAGDVIKNLSAFSQDGLVLKWGYVMCDLRVTDTITGPVRLTNGPTIRPVQHFTTHVKKRLHATPYGFGLDPDWKDFSSRQLAILGALGITRGR